MYEGHRGRERERKSDVTQVLKYVLFFLEFMHKIYTTVMANVYEWNHISGIRMYLSFSLCFSLSLAFPFPRVINYIEERQSEQKQLIVSEASSSSKIITHSLLQSTTIAHSYCGTNYINLS